MTLLGIGVDVLHVPRLARLLSKRGIERFANRILSTQELGDLQTVSTDGVQRFLGVRVKEAAYKALYPTYKATWKDLTYASFDSASARKPSLQFHPVNTGSRAATLHVSISHDGDYIFATVLAEKT